MPSYTHYKLMNIQKNCPGIFAILIYFTYFNQDTYTYFKSNDF